MKAAARLLALVLAASFAAGGALAQRERADGRARPGHAMSQDQRRQMREDMREVYRERGLERAGRPERPHQLSPEERERLRRDVQNANRELRR